MRLGWAIHLPGPFYLSGGGRKRRKKTLTAARMVPGSMPVQDNGFHGQLPSGQLCPHAHRSEDTAIDCAAGESRRAGYSESAMVGSVRGGRLTSYTLLKFHDGR